MIFRYFIELAYNGKNYHGWQIQPNATTVQSVLDNALSLILNCPVTTVGAGRTDTGVHAKFFVAHFELDFGIVDIDSTTFKLNSFLPSDICIKRIFNVSVEAHARFSAISRTYEYHISTLKNPFLAESAYFVHRNINFESMNEAANLLTYYTDFTSFSKLHSDTKTNNCKIIFAHWASADDGKYFFTIKADRFLRNMVRAVVGTLLDVGYGKKNIQEFCKIIESRDRCEAGQSVPPHGLYLVDIDYPPEIVA